MHILVQLHIMQRVQSFFSDKANQRDHISQMPSYITSLRIRPIISVDTVGPVGRRGARSMVA